MCFGDWFGRKPKRPDKELIFRGVGIGTECYYNKAWWRFLEVYESRVAPYIQNYLFDLVTHKLEPVDFCKN